MLEGEVDVVADGARTRPAGDVFWTGTGWSQRSTRRGRALCGGSRHRRPTAAPLVPAERDWNYLAERLASDAGVGAT